MTQNIDPKLYDKRTYERMISRGLLTKQEYDLYLQSLPDLALTLNEEDEDEDDEESDVDEESDEEESNVDEEDNKEDGEKEIA